MSSLCWLTNSRGGHTWLGLRGAPTLSEGPTHHKFRNEPFTRSLDPHCAHKLRILRYLAKVSASHDSQSGTSASWLRAPRIQMWSHFPRFELTRSVRALLGDAPIIERLMWVGIKLTDQCLHPARASARARREVGGQAPPIQAGPGPCRPPQAGAICLC